MVAKTFLSVTTKTDQKKEEEEEEVICLLNCCLKNKKCHQEFQLENTIDT